MEFFRSGPLEMGGLSESFAPGKMGLSARTRRRVDEFIMSLLAQFHTAISGADHLVDLYREMRKSRGIGARGRLDDTNTDLLWLPRSAIVVTLSALDSYVHHVLYDRIPVTLSAQTPPEKLCEEIAAIATIKNGKTFREVLPILKAGNSLKQLAEKMRQERLSFVSYQAPDKIIAGYRLIGYGNIFDDVSKLWQGPNTSSADIRNTLSNYVKRRNQVAHEGDIDGQGSPRPMQPQYALKCRSFVNDLVERLDRVVYGTSR